MACRDTKTTKKYYETSLIQYTGREATTTWQVQLNHGCAWISGAQEEDHNGGLGPHHRDGPNCFMEDKPTNNQAINN